MQQKKKERKNKYETHYALLFNAHLWRKPGAAYIRHYVSLFFFLHFFLSFDYFYMLNQVYMPLSVLIFSFFPNKRCRHKRQINNQSIMIYICTHARTHIFFFFRYVQHSVKCSPMRAFRGRASDCTLRAQFIP